MQMFTVDRRGSIAQGEGLEVLLFFGGSEVFHIAWPRDGASPVLSAAKRRPNQSRRSLHTISDVRGNARGEILGLYRGACILFPKFALYLQAAARLMVW